jgi:transposase
VAQRGAKAQAIGVSRGGRTTKIHAVCDLLGQPLALGNTSDIKTTPVLITMAGQLKRLIADRGHDANGLRHHLKAAGTKPIIPGRRNRKRPIRHDHARYAERWRIEAVFHRLMNDRSVATRYDKLATNYLASVQLAAIIGCWC